MQTTSTTVSPARRVALAFVALTVALTAFLAFGAAADAREKVDPDTRTETREHVLLARPHVAVVDQLAVLDFDGGGNDGPWDGPDDISNCPQGTTPVAFDMPIYDEDGIFVIGHKTVWICVDVNAEPAG